MVRQRPLVSPAALLVAVALAVAMVPIALAPPAGAQDAPKPEAGKPSAIPDPKPDLTRSKPEVTESKPAALSRPPEKAAPQPKAAAKARSAKEKGTAADLGSRPYKIRAWVVVEPGARLDAKGRAALISAWLTLARRFVGPPWELEVAEGAGPLLGGDLDAVAPDAIAERAAGRDKAWLILIGPGGGDSLLFSGREFDAATFRLGRTLQRTAAYPVDAPRVLLGLALEMFSPYAEIGELAGGGVKITVQGAALPAGDPVGRVVVPGSAFRLVRLTFDIDGLTIARSKVTGAPIIRDVPHSFLRVEEVEGPVARCTVISAMRDPLTKRALRSRVVALGIKPTVSPTRFRFVVPPEKRESGERRGPIAYRPAAGFVLTARNAPNGSPREVGMTDREGRIALPAGFADGLVVLRLQAGSNEPLVEFPAMPGESAVEQTIPVQPKPEAVALVSALNALYDELVDLVGIRRRLESRIEARIKASNWEEARDMIGKYRALPARKQYEERIAQLKQKALEDQRAVKRAVLTVTAQRRIADVEGLLDHFLTEEVIGGFEEEVKPHGGPVKPAPKAETAKAPAPAVAPPPAAPAPKAG